MNNLKNTQDGRKSNKNVLFIILDTLRSDAINGAEKSSVTPNMDYLISNGVNFTQATCSVHGTISSLGSLFSSKWPFKTGLGSRTYNEMNFYVKSCLEIISMNNYNIFTIIPNVISHLGFFKNVKKDETGFSSERNLDEGLDKMILKKVREINPLEPWFCYIHLNDLHSPVSAPRSVNNEKFGRNQYDRTISSIDMFIGKILEEIDLKDTIIIITSDHGQNPRLSEYEPPGFQKIYWKIDKNLPTFIRNQNSKIISRVRKHTLDTKENFDVYDDVIRVPLILAGGDLPKNLEIKNQVNHIDIFPTLEQLLGLSETLDDPDGTSLMGLIREEDTPDRPVYIESPPQKLENNTHVIGIRTSNYKYFRSISNAKKDVRLYDLKKDPQETENIASGSASIVNNLEQELQNILSAQNDTKQNQSMASDDVKKIAKELKKMGYL